MLGNVSDLIMKTRPWLILISKYKLIGLIISESAELPLNCPGFNSRWEQCKNRALRPLQGTVNGGAVSKWPSYRWDAIKTQPTNQPELFLDSSGRCQKSWNRKKIYCSLTLIGNYIEKYFKLEIWNFIHVWDKNKTSINVRLYKEK